MASMIAGIISVSISAVLLASVFIAQVKAENRTYVKGNESFNWSASEISMWGLLTLVSIVGLLYGVLAIFGLA